MRYGNNYVPESSAKGCSQAPRAHTYVSIMSLTSCELVLLSYLTKNLQCSC
eukprot:c30139_g1_i1 orf=1-150(-)